MELRLFLKISLISEALKQLRGSGQLSQNDTLVRVSLMGALRPYCMYVLCRSKSNGKISPTQTLLNSSSIIVFGNRSIRCHFPLNSDAVKMIDYPFTNANRNSIDFAYIFRHFFHHRSDEVERIRQILNFTFGLT